MPKENGQHTYTLKGCRIKALKGEGEEAIIIKAQS